MLAVRASLFATLVAGSLAASVRPATAADLGSPSGDSGERYARSWQGGYLGAVIGSSALGVDIGGLARRDGADLEDSAISGGVLAGYNFTGGPWVWGIEADVEFDGLETSKRLAGLGTVDVEQGWQGSLRLRGGYAWDTLLLYATAGLAVTEVEFRSSLGGRDGLGMVSLVAGIGAEYAVSNDWRLRAEALAYGADNAGVTIAGREREVDFGHGSLRLGVAHRF